MLARLKGGKPSFQGLHEHAMEVGNSVTEEAAPRGPREDMELALGMAPTASWREVGGKLMGKEV